MKLLFDENLSYRLVAALDDLYAGSSHVREIGLVGSGDERIWDHAAAHGFILVSKDTDFYQRSVVFGAPPRVIWLRVGNGPTRAISDVLRQQYVAVRRFADHPDATFLILPVA